VGSTLTGMASTGADATSSVSLDNRSTWNMTDSSNLTTLVNNGVVNFVHLGHTLTTATLSGAGNFHLETDIAAGVTDCIVIDEFSEGNHVLYITNVGANPSGTEADLVLVYDYSSGDAVFSGTASAGMYKYEVQFRDAGLDGYEWFLGLVPGLGDGGSDLINLTVGNNDWFINSVNQNANQLGNSRAGIDWNTRSIAPASSGYSKGGGGKKNVVALEKTRDWNIWAQTYGQQRNYHLPIEGVTHARAIFYGAAIGADQTWDLDEDNKLITGIFGAYDGSNLDFRRNGDKAEGYSFGAGAYATWAERSGYYADALVKVSALHQDLRSSEKASFNNVGVGLYLDAGKRYDLEADWYIEPSLAFTYAHMTGYNYLVSVESANIYQFRAATALGKRVEDVTLFGKVGVAEQTSSGGKLTDGLNTWTPNSNGLRAELTLGAIWQLDANNMLSLSYNASFGKKYTQPWGVNFGFTHKF